jgi:bisanhydrobacterioruberin hydratase
MRASFRFVAFGSFLCYVALFPGSTTTVALNAVPAWGIGMGAALLFLQGIAAVAWLLACYGRRGFMAGAAAFVLAWAVEHLGETTGFLFGRYYYTDVLQPQILGVVPVPITCAWLMVAVGSWQLAGWLVSSIQPVRVAHLSRLILTATLVVGLDLQLETIATRVNQYWVWIDTGRYYGVPTLNFIMWWVVGFGMACLMHWILAAPQQPVTTLPRIRNWIFQHIPGLLYILSCVMFTIVNIANGYVWAGVVGIVILCGLATILIRQINAVGWQIGPTIASAWSRTSD